MLSGNLKSLDNSARILSCSSGDNFFEDINFAFNSPLLFETKFKKLSIILFKKNNLFLIAKKT